LGAQREVLGALDSRVSQQIDLIATVCGGVEHAGFATGGRASANCDYMEHAAFRDGRKLCRDCSGVGVTQLEAAKRLQPAGAIYHSIDESDMRRILAHPATMIGSDGLPNDPRPHPRLWVRFARAGAVLRDEKLMTLPEAVRKMTVCQRSVLGCTARAHREDFMQTLSCSMRSALWTRQLSASR